MAEVKSKTIQKAQPKKTVEKREDILVKKRFVRTPPDKVRLVGSLIRGKSLDQSLSILEFTNKAAVKPLILIVKNAKNITQDRGWENAWIKTVIVDEAPKLKRRRMIHRGRATSILKRNSHIGILITDNNPKAKEKNGS